MSEGFHATKNGSPSRPFIKWAGGKSQLLEQLSRLLPDDLARRPHLTYVEPFVGGGAMLFYMLERFPNIERAVVNDLNGDLIVTYKMVKECVHELIAALDELQREYRACSDEDDRKAMYLARRDRYNQRGMDDIETAALFIFLNRTCFNGLYRVNSKGRFNVPFGKAGNPLICDPSTLLTDSATLQKVEILHGDFASVEKHVMGKAFFYFDPPYRPLTPTSSFTAYDKGGFGDDQQRRLAEFCKRLDTKGYQWLLSNSDPYNVNPDDTFFENIYSRFEIRRVSASRMINSKTDGRGKITELAIRNYATANRHEASEVLPTMRNIREPEECASAFRYETDQIK